MTVDTRTAGTGAVVVLRGDARNLPLPDASVDLIVTSPPYFALRSYTDGGEHYAGQIGAETTPAEYIAALIACTREWVRVLKPSGSLWVNLGDKYSATTTWATKHGRGSNSLASGEYIPRDSVIKERPLRTGVPLKSLILLPERYRIAAVDELGLIARAVVIWNKPNGLPESVTDRVRRSHEDWVHLTRLPRYFAAVDEIREPHAAWTLKAYAYEQRNGGYNRRKNPNRVDEGDAADYAVANPLGKLPGSVWEIAGEPLKVPAALGVDHFAAFPTEWPKRIIAGWSPSGICTACGEGRRPVSDSQITADRGGRQFNPTSGNIGVLGKERVYRITGEACACAEPTAPARPAVVLDPFGGTGTTALVASALGRIGISNDMSADYCRIAEWRTADPAQRAKVLGLAKPPVQLDGQGDLLAELASR